MQRVLWQSLALAATGFLSAGSLTIVVVLLLSPRGWRNGLGYAVGYTLSYVLLGAGVVLIGYRAAAQGDAGEGLAGGLFLLLFGGLLLWVGVKNWRRPAQEGAPGFVQTLDGMTPWKSFGFGLLVPLLNFKNLPLFLTALSVVVMSDLPLGEKLLIAWLTALVFSLAIAIPVLIVWLFPQRATAVLQPLKDWLNRYRRPQGIGVPLFFGALFLAKAAALLGAAL